MELRDVMALEVGDTLMLSAAPDDCVDLRCNGITMMNGTMGRIGKNIAISVVQNFRQVKGLK